MSGLLHLNLIKFLDFYFAFIFFIGTLRRWGQYQSVGRLVLSMPQRWPRLLQLVRDHRMIFVTWQNVAPALMALLLSLVQLFASRFVWPEAGEPEPNGLTVGRLLEYWPVLIVAGPLALAMLGMDLYGLYLVGQVDRPLMEKYFDQAEYWLGSHTAHVVRVVTFGYLNPRRMVADEVRKALLAVSGLLNYTLWWVIVQVTLRFSFGLVLWLTWAVHRAI